MLYSLTIKRILHNEVEADFTGGAHYVFNYDVFADGYSYGDIIAGRRAEFRNINELRMRNGYYAHNT